ncbi:MAG: PEP-CTERM sorting domain-containing protein [Planctomycetes bacterium]|nr:PEP-CTERM sorting domain-containing protein [Planctomycetota bacterium]
MFVPQRSIAIAVTLALVLSLASLGRASTVGYWTFDDKAPGNNAGTLVSEVNSPTMDATAHANGTTGALPVHDASVPLAFVRDGVNGTIINAADSASLKFNNPDAPFPIDGGFSGSSNGGYANVADPGGNFFNITGSFTVEGFVRIESNVNFATLVGKARNGNNSSWEIDTNNTGKLRVRVDSNTVYPDAGSGDGAFNQSITSNFNLEDGLWHHFAMTYNASTRTVTLFGDYTQVGSAVLSDSGVMHFDSNSLFFGANAGGRALDGWLDEVRISDTLLTPNQFLTIVPEPTSFAMLGVSGLALMRRRRA